MRRRERDEGTVKIERKSRRGEEEEEEKIN